MLYKKPEIKIYSTDDLLETIGPCQNQYTTTTLTTSTQTGAVNIDGVIVYNGVSNRVAFEPAENSLGTGNRPELVVTYR